jgi:hypothetical protein
MITRRMKVNIVVSQFVLCDQAHRFVADEPGVG